MNALQLNRNLADVDLSEVITQLTGRPAWFDLEEALEPLGLPMKATMPVVAEVQAQMREVIEAAFLAGVVAGQDPLALLASCVDRIEGLCDRLEGSNHDTK